MTRIKKRRQRHSRQNTSLPGIFGVATTNATIEGLSLAAHLNSLTRPTDFPAILSSLRGQMFSSANVDQPSFATTISGSFPDFAPFYATDTSMASATASAKVYGPGAAIVADSSASEITTSSQSSAGESVAKFCVKLLIRAAVGATVLASPLSAGSPTSISSTDTSESSTILTSSSISPAAAPTSIDSSGPSSIAALSTTSSWSSTSTQSHTSTASSNGPDFSCDAHGDYSCLWPKHNNRDYYQKVIGAAVGTGVGILLVAIVVFLWRWRRRKLAIQRGSPERQSKWYKSRKWGGATSKDADVNVRPERVMLADENDTLGEPGPAFNSNDAETKDRNIPDADIPMRTYKRSSTSSWYDRPINPFRSTESTTTDNQFSSSKIGVALTRYSTAESTLPLSKPISLMKEHKPCSRSSTTLSDGHNRHSSTSISSDATTRLDLDFTPLQTATVARRHSLTPRVINIVAAGGSSDRISPGGNKDNDISPGFNDINRNSVRSRSMSPSKLLSGYASFVDEISDHRPDSQSHIQKSSQDSSDQTSSSASSKTKVLKLTKYPDIPDRGRSMARTAEAHISFPPTSYPKLGKTIEDVKKTIREKGGAAFASSDDLRGIARRSGAGNAVAELPSNVTVTRVRGG